MLDLKIDPETRIYLCPECGAPLEARVEAYWATSAKANPDPGGWFHPDVYDSTKGYTFHTNDTTLACPKCEWEEDDLWFLDLPMGEDE